MGLESEEYPCEGFDMKGFTYDPFFKGSLSYTDGQHTQVINMTDKRKSKPFKAYDSGFVSTGCRPSLMYHYVDKQSSLEIDYLFQYDLQDKKHLELEIIINSNRGQISLDKNKKLPKEIVIDQVEYLPAYQVDSATMIKKMNLSYGVVSSFEYYSGEKWMLISSKSTSSRKVKQHA